HVHLPRQGWPTLISLVWHRFRLRLRGLSFKRRDESQLSRETLERLDIFNSLADGMGLADYLLGAQLSTRWIREALKVGEPQRVLKALYREANFVAASGHWDSAYQKKILQAIEDLRREVVMPTSEGWLFGAQAYQSFMKGQWHEALDRAREGIATFSPTNSNYWESSTLHFLLLWANFYLGDLTTMEQLTRPNLHDAMDRGDMLAASGNILGLNTIVFIKEKGPDKARDAADWVITNWTASKFHLQHYWHLLSHLLIDFYTMEEERAIHHLEENWGPLKKSHLLLLPSIRNEALYLRARVSLARAKASTGSTRKSHIARALKDSRLLTGGKLDWPRALGNIIAAHSWLMTGHEEEAITLLQSTRDSLLSMEMMFYAAAVNHKLGRTVGGDQGATFDSLANAYFSSHKIPPSKQEHFSRMLIP
ncbi:hypothetical protein KKF84_01990, partial [Myxococcota bacterium]|nr:hypothetical protein [Myxococcota bacterium]MBU1534057.1 hypothetical protein [Myxococcota bacterium]